MNQHLRVNKYSVKFIPEIDKINDFAILVWSPVKKDFFFTNKDTYDLLLFIYKKNPTIDQTIKHFNMDDHNIKMLQYLIKIQLLILTV